MCVCVCVKVMNVNFHFEATVMLLGREFNLKQLEQYNCPLVKIETIFVTQYPLVCVSSAQGLDMTPQLSQL